MFSSCYVVQMFPLIGMFEPLSLKEPTALKFNTKGRKLSAKAGFL